MSRFAMHPAREPSRPNHGMIVCFDLREKEYNSGVREWKTIRGLARGRS